MSWIIFWVYVITFVAAMAVLLYSVLTSPEKFTPGNVALAAINGILGVGLRPIIAHLYPKRPS
jgi:formiminotetrahydrofolate cyclodeaminase